MDSYIKLLPDAGAENKLVKLFRSMGESEVFNILDELLSRNDRRLRHSALRMVARGCVRESELLFQILDKGLRRRDVSEVKLWIRSVISVLGSKKVILHLEKEFVPNEVGLIVLAWYYLEQVVDVEERDVLSELLRLKQLIEENKKSLLEDEASYWEAINDT